MSQHPLHRVRSFDRVGAHTLHVEFADGSRQTIDFTPVLSRRTPDGTLLQWQVVVVREPGLGPVPFFIEWSKDTTHPSTGSPTGCRLARMELAHPEPARLQSFFAAAAFPAAIAAGQRPEMRLTLDCPRGRVGFTT